MKPLIISLISLFASVLLASSVSAQTICFQRKGAVWLADARGGNQRCVISAATVKKLEAVDFRISPDGKLISFTQFVGDAVTDRYRGIALLEIKTKQVALLDSVPELNNYNALWSPDASTLAFVYPHKARPDGVSLSVATIKKDNTGFTIVSETLGPKAYTVYFYSWTNDGGTILCYAGDDSLYAFALDGHLVSSEPFVMPSSDSMGIFPSTSTNMTVSPDGRYIAVDPEVYDDGSEHFKNYWVDTHYGAVLLYDRKMGTLIRVSPKSLSASCPVWSAQEHEIWFCGITGGDPKGHRSNIYRTDLKGDKITLVIKDAYDISMSYK